MYLPDGGLTHHRNVEKCGVSSSLDGEENAACWARCLAWPALLCNTCVQDEGFVRQVLNDYDYNVDACIAVLLGTVSMPAERAGESRRNHSTVHVTAGVRWLLQTSLVNTC